MTDTQELAEEAIAETEVAPTPDVETLLDYTRLVWVRIRSGESGVLPVVGGFLLISILFQRRNPQGVEGLILSAPYLELALKPSPFKVFTSKLVGGTLVSRPSTCPSCVERVLGMASVR